jgi:hypothetical protein
LAQAAAKLTGKNSPKSPATPSSEFPGELTGRQKFRLQQRAKRKKNKQLLSSQELTDSVEQVCPAAISAAFSDDRAAAKAERVAKVRGKAWKKGKDGDAYRHLNAYELLTAKDRCIRKEYGLKKWKKVKKNKLNVTGLREQEKSESAEGGVAKQQQRQLDKSPKLSRKQRRQLKDLQQGQPQNKPSPKWKNEVKANRKKKAIIEAYIRGEVKKVSAKRRQGRKQKLQAA